MDDNPVIFFVRFNNLLRHFTKTRGDVTAWNELVENLNQFTFSSSRGTIKVTIDWGDTKEFVAQSEYYSLKINEIKTQQDFDAYIDKFNGYVRLKSTGAIISNLFVKFFVYNSSNELDNFGYVINALYQIFFVMNLSAPGSCDLYLTSVRLQYSDKGFIQEDLTPKEQTLWLTSSLIEGSIAIAEQLNWRVIHNVPVQKTLSWMQKNEFSESCLARSNVERAIFGMLHACSEVDGVHPTTLISLAQALEALFDTPKMGISSILRDRVFLVLGAPEENQNKIRRAINAFYDYRSRYVHGETSIPNPMSRKLSDETSDDFYNELLQHIEFAMLILVASLQQLIVKDGDGFEFSENVSVKPL
jgi:hypothetical protein